MRTFIARIDARVREAMVAFLREHDRYWTMNSWNRSTSYANCVKVHRLGLTEGQLDRAWQVLDVAEVYDAIHRVLEEWAAEREWRWQVGFNGRSGGYLVLYQGALDWRNARAAQCDSCGRVTWHRQDTPCTSDHRDGTLRVLPEPRPQVVTYPGRGLDEAEDFADWAMSDLRDRVRLVQDFDRVCDAAVAQFVRFCNCCRVAEQEITAPWTVKVLERA